MTTAPVPSCPAVPSSPSSPSFPPARSRRPPRQLPHGRHAVVTCVLAALATASAASGLDDAIARFAFDATTAIAFALGPLVVALLKSVTGPRCPWDLIEFGGAWQPTADLFTGPSGAGHCFPSGHASGGYALLSLYFAGVALGEACLSRLGLWLGLIAGTVYGAVRIAQGAHFLSHNLSAAAVVWAVAALVFAIAYPRSGPRRIPLREPST